MTFMDDDGIRCPVCRGSGHVVGEEDRILCTRCGGTGAWREPGYVRNILARATPKEPT